QKLARLERAWGLVYGAIRQHQWKWNRRSSDATIGRHTAADSIDFGPRFSTLVNRIAGKRGADGGVRRRNRAQPDVEGRDDAHQYPVPAAAFLRPDFPGFAF